MRVGAVSLTQAEAARAELDRRAALARAELERRRETPEGRAELADYAEATILSRLHDKQRMVVALVFAVVRYIAAECSRRAGKTHLAAAIIVLKLLRAKRGQEVVFCAPTLQRGKELIWEELTGMLDEYHLGWKRQENTGRIRTSTGALFRIVGLNNKKQIGKISRGGNTIGFMADECFPAGTLVDGIPIETIKIGDYVWSVDHDTGDRAKRRVGSVMKHIARSMVSVKHSGGVLACTGNHPVFVRGRGYVHAEEIEAGDLLCVFDAVPSNAGEERSPQDVLSSVSDRTDALDPGSFQPDERRGHTSEGRLDAASDWSPAVGTGRQRHGPERVRDASSVDTAELLGPWSRYSHAEVADVGCWPRGGAGLGLPTPGDRGGRRPDLRLVCAAGRGEREQGRRKARADSPGRRGGRVGDPATLLQGRPGMAGSHDCHRGGRAEPQVSRPTGEGPQEGARLVWSRVDSVTRQELGSEGGPDVYNLEVEGGHTYFAEGVLVHNCQEFPHLLQELLIAVGPALAQSRGTFLAMGTPTVNEADYWAQVCDGAEGFQRVHWTLLDNPFLGRPPEDILAEEMERNGWTESSPTFVREYKGRRCKDPSNLVFETTAANVIPAVPGFDPAAWELDLTTGELSTDIAKRSMRARWRFFIGVDFGLRDATAWVVLAASLYGPEVYAVHCEQEAGLDWDEVADRTKKLCDVYQPRAVVGDSASGGAQFVQTFNKRYAKGLGFRARHAIKHDKKANIEIMNTELRKKRLMFLEPAAKQLFDEASALQWANAERTEVLDGAAYPEDLSDAFRYAFNEFRAFITKEEEKVKTDAQVEQEAVERRMKNERDRQARGRGQRAR